MIMGMLIQEGYIPCPDPEEAHLILINTCSFLQDAVREAIETILEMAQRKRPGTTLLVAGCLPQRYKDEVAKEIPEVDLWVGPGDLGLIPQLLKERRKGVFVSRPENFLYDSSMPRVLFNNPFVAYVKIAEGCRHRCSFCIIPKIRGRFRSRPKEDILREVRLLVQRGVKEIVLVAQDTTSYGIDLGYPQLLGLLEEILAIQGFHWVRVLYCYPHPKLLPEGLLELMATEERIAPYLDLPIQHISDKILRAMGRMTTRRDLLRLFEVLGRYPRIALRGTVIVGFPGEGEEEFRELYDFLAQGFFTHLGVFKFSPEEGTPAAFYPDQVPEEAKEERYATLMKLQQRISLRKNQALVGKEVKVMVEGFAEKKFSRGRTAFQAPEIDGVTLVKGLVEPGRLVEGKIIGAGAYDLLVEIPPRGTLKGPHELGSQKRGIPPFQDLIDLP